MFRLVFFQALIIVLFCSFFYKKDEPKRLVKTIVIDPGHGGKDPGCNGAEHKEKDVALAVALRLGKLIEDNLKNVKVIYTRKTDVFVELEDRATIANENNADLFISIHCNAAGKPVMIKDKKTGKMRAKTFKNSRGKTIVVETSNPVPFGSETYVMGLKNEEGKMKVAQRENSVILMEDNYQSKYEGFDPDSEESYIIMSNYTSGYVLQSASLALKIQEEYSKKAGRVDKGVHRQSIWVLWRTSMPSVLTEIGYLTNPEEEKFLGSEKGKDYMAACLFRAFRKYKDELEGITKVYSDDLEKQKPLENQNIKQSNESTPEKITMKNPETLDLIVKEDNERIEDDNEINEDTDVLVDKKDIIKTYKDKNKKDTLSAITSLNIIESGIIFKVQFASSDVKVDISKNYTNVPDVGFYNVKSIYKYTSGNYKTISEAIKQQNKLRELGYKDCFVIAFKDGIRMDVNEARRLTHQ